LSFSTTSRFSRSSVGPSDAPQRERRRLPCPFGDLVARLGVRLVPLALLHVTKAVHTHALSFPAPPSGCLLSLISKSPSLSCDLAARGAFCASCCAPYSRALPSDPRWRRPRMHWVAIFRATTSTNGVGEAPASHMSRRLPYDTECTGSLPMCAQPARA
jgi:hypothetical protein